MWEAVANTLSGSKGLQAAIDYMRSKVAQIGVIATVDEARTMGSSKFQIIGEKGAAALDAAEEATTRLDNLTVAREMEAAGKDAKTIRLATGWERGPSDINKIINQLETQGRIKKIPCKN